ncbi:hypothetical protein HDV02_005364 [Globomyces sp. JEL0801]|nr:hypothetical protein HDV02_005364 [Globomyces sp. JEL0801]
MRGPKRKKVYKKKNEKQYNSDSESEQETTGNLKYTKKDLADLDIVNDNHYSDSDDVENLDELNDSDVVQDDDDKETGVKKIPQVKKSVEEIEEGKSTKLASIIGKILDTKIPTNRPVLSLKRKIETDIDDAKLEEKARKLMTKEKKVQKDIGRLIPDNTTLDYEKKLRKTATRGVVQLFNALRAAQKSANEVESESVLMKADQVSTVSKETFIKALKQEKLKSEEKDSKSEKVETNAEKAVPFLRNDFSMTEPKHWDEEEEVEDF